MSSNPAASVALALAFVTCAAVGCSSEVPTGDAPDVVDEGVDTQAKAPPPGGPITIMPRLGGRVRCSVPDGGRRVALPVASLPIEINGQRVTTDSNGQFSLAGSFASRVNVRVIYEGPITSGGVTTPLQIMNDIKNTRTESHDRAVTGTTPFRTVGDIDLVALDCELFRIGGNVLRDYHAVRAASPPAGKLRIQRWNEIRTAPHAFYDYINISPDWFDSYTSIADRDGTLLHEFGHTLRHVFDGPQHHWDWDNFRWAYARSHSGTEIFNTQYAFNEGWASFWELTRTPPAPAPFTDRLLSADNLHWNERLIANRLLALAALPGASTRIMLDVLEANPGTIHSLHEFETRLNARLGRAAPPPPPSCPPDFVDEGATCRQGGDVVAKPSFGRGVGTVPTSCGAGNELDAGLCYPECAPGFHGVGPVC